MLESIQEQPDIRTPRNGPVARSVHLTVAPPSISESLLKGFLLYVRWYLARHFHSIRLSAERTFSLPSGTNAVVFLNHASWWDPLVCLFLKQHLAPTAKVYAPIEAAALSRYPFLGKLGLFGVEAGTLRGAAKFLQVGEAVLRQPNSMLWITPQGRFADVRERPLRLEPGLGHLAARTQDVLFIPLAIEYTFWTERLPEVLLRCGEPIRQQPGGDNFDARHWTAVFQQKLQQTQDELAALAQAREATAFQVILSGQAGVGGVYDTWRHSLALWRGQHYQPSHASQ